MLPRLVGSWLAAPRHALATHHAAQTNPAPPSPGDIGPDSITVLLPSERLKRAPALTALAQRERGGGGYKYKERGGLKLSCATSDI